MTFDEFDAKMRVFETASDICVLPEMFFVARLDGRSFTRLTKNVLKFEAPYDVRFRDLMVSTAKSLMYSGCLLYTSPSPRDGLLSRMPSSA